MTKRHVTRTKLSVGFFTLNCFLLIAFILTSCAGVPVPGLATPTPPIPTATSFQQSLPPALVETAPPIGSVLGHQSPITFYFNQAMNKSSVESALTGLPSGTFTWNDEATLIFTPTQPYQPNTTLKFSIANSIQSANGFGMAYPIDLEFAVADYLRATNLLPKADATDVNVDAAIAVSFDQPVVALGADSSAQPPAFSVQPSVSGRGEWINTSTYIFYPEPSMAGGMEYTVSLNPALKTVTGVGLPEGGSGQTVWTFTTSRPRVVTLNPASDQLLPLDPEIKLTFNQPMDRESVQANFLFRGTEGALDGKFAWNEDNSELTFRPSKLLDRNVGYILNVGGAAKSKGGMTLGSDYGVVLTTYDNFAVTSTHPESGSTTFTFNSPLAKGNYDNAVKVSPAVDNFQVDVTDDDLNLYVYGDFIPDTNYAIELSAGIKDRWGQSLGDAFILNVRMPPLPSMVNVQLYGSNIAFVRPDEPVLYANAVNVQNADVKIAPLSLQDFFSLQNSYENQQAYASSDPSTYSQAFELTPNEWHEVKLNLAQQNNQLLPGLYFVNIDSSQIQSDSKIIYFAASSHVNLTFKLGATEALVWAVDLPSQTLLANEPVTIYDNAGNQLGSGTTDENGLWKGTVSQPVGQVYAMLGQPGDDNFALAVNSWGMGISGWDFGYSQRVQPPHTQIYMYTDRPIYRTGQTVYFRGVARQAFNGRYELPLTNTIPLILRDTNGVQLSNFDLQLSPYGTFNGQFAIPQEAVPGYYTFENSAFELYFSFQVAEYRKPEINLSVDFSSDEMKLGDSAQANINARYFFDAPASDVEVHWALYTKPDYFYLPNYQSGLLDTSWLDVFHMPDFSSSDYFGNLVKEGTGRTTPEGILSMTLPAIPESETGQVVTLEVTAQDESGLPVSARAEMHVHPADFYIGLHPDQWAGRAGSPLGFDVYTVDWAKTPSANQTLSAEFKQVRWEKETDSTGYPTYTPVYTPVSSSNLRTGPDGKARLSFVPPTAGTFMLDVSGDGAHTQILIWAGGVGAAAWPDLPNQRFEITADRDSYKAGDTAKIFIPNPFITNSLALVTVERGLVSKAEVITLSGSGNEYSLPLTEDDAPNVYVSVTVLGQGNDFRDGLVNLPVTPKAEALNVQVASNPAQAGPRDNVTFDVSVTDSKGQPVEGEFSLSVVDLATLALADPNAQDILPAFYSNQPLGIETGLSLAAYSGRNAIEPGGFGGGGGAGVTVVRENFPDTAYWNPSLITNSEGRGQVTMTLPDSLTTWQVDVRGLTVDTKVGQAETQIVATKPLLIRPVTPRFLVNGDHVLIAAIVNNNTSNQLSVDVNLAAEGFVLDDPEKEKQTMEVPANDRVRVEWWGTAKQDEDPIANMVFSAVSHDDPPLSDKTRPVWGSLPIIQYTSPQAFVTGGVLRGAASQHEVISLPRTFMPTGGSLDVELSPSLAGSLLSALNVMDLPDYVMSAEATLSYFLPNLEVYRALNSAGLSDPDLSKRVTSNVGTSISRLLSLQNNDGGWSWWGKSEKSDAYISAYVFFGLLRARTIGMTVDENALQRAGTYLSGLKPEITMDTKGAMLDQITFVQFVLAQANTFDETLISKLYDARDRMSPSSKAWLAYVLNAINPADARVHDLISNLESSAILTASSAHWETPSENILTTGSPIYTTSIVVYVLAQLDSANQVLFNAVRYLAAHRDVHGLWGMGHENAWAMMALNEAMVGFGDLNADFTFNATLNDGPLTSGDISGNQVLTPINAQVPLGYLSPTLPNLLTIQREDGLGRLYYRAVLQVNRPVEEVQPLDEGMRIDRVYCASEETKVCTPLSAFQLPFDRLRAALTNHSPRN